MDLRLLVRHQSDDTALVELSELRANTRRVRLHKTGAGSGTLLLDHLVDRRSVVGSEHVGQSVPTAEKMVEYFPVSQVRHD